MFGSLRLRPADRPADTWPYLCAAITAGFIAFYAGWLAFGIGGEEGLTLQSNIVYHVPLIVATITLVLAARGGTGIARAAWLTAAAGTAFLALGELTWTVYDYVLGKEVPVPSIADIFYYLGDLSLILAFVLLVMPGASGKATWRSLVDATLVAVSLAALSWYFVLQPVASATHLSTIGTASTLGYPLLDLVMIIVIVAALYRRADSHIPIPVFLLGLGTVFIALSDTIYVHLVTVQGYDTTGNPVELGWVIGYALFALSGALQWKHFGSMEATTGLPDRQTGLGFVTPYMVAVPVLGLLVWTAFVDEPTVVLPVAACVLVLGIALRQWITILDLNDRERLIHHMAYHDPLTALPNRALLEDRAEQGLAFARRHGSGLAVISVDLDRFKLVNDNRGHLFGDKLLRSVAAALKGAVRETDTVARVGGDEFIILLQDIDTVHDAEAIAGKLLTAVRAVKVDDEKVDAMASIGVALFPRDGESTQELWSRADAAMYVAKQGGRDRMEVYGTPVALAPSEVGAS
jgi:diguanylate cyclase (GGDEF)-like protein